MAELGHIVFYVKDLAKSRSFYENVVGLNVVGSVFNDRAVIFSSGRSHHELLLIEVGDAPGPLTGHRRGLYHVGWKLGEDLDDLRAALKRAEDFGAEIVGQSDHTVSKSLYLLDPDGNELELYVDDPCVDWKNNSDWLEQPVKRLDL